MGHINALFVVGKGLVESPIMVLQEIVSVSNSTRTYEQKEEESLSFNGKVSPSLSVRPYQPPLPFPQRVAWAKLSKLESKFTRFSGSAEVNLC